MITTLYIILLIAGLIVAALGLLGLSRAFVPGSQAQPDASAQALRLVPLALGAGAAVFGAVGLILRAGTGLPPGETVVWALAAGLLAGFAVEAVLYVRVLRRVAAQPPPVDPDQGLRAQVVITIPSNGIGQISYRSDGRSVSAGAGSATFETIPAGTTVVIDRVIRTIAIVRPIQAG
jgi:hypothetical protein